MKSVSNHRPRKRIFGEDEETAFNIRLETRKEHNCYETTYWLLYSPRRAIPLILLVISPAGVQPVSSILGVVDEELRVGSGRPPMSCPSYHSWDSWEHQRQEHWKQQLSARQGLYLSARTLQEGVAHGSSHREHNNQNKDSILHLRPHRIQTTAQKHIKQATRKGCIITRHQVSSRPHQSINSRIRVARVLFHAHGLTRRTYLSNGVEVGSKILSKDLRMCSRLWS